MSKPTNGSYGARNTTTHHQEQPKRGLRNNDDSIIAYRHFDHEGASRQPAIPEQTRLALPFEPFCQSEPPASTRQPKMTMASRSFKPSSLTLRPRRPSIARSSSASSTKSRDHPSPLSQEAYNYRSSFESAGPESPSEFSVALGSPVILSGTHSSLVSVHLAFRTFFPWSGTPDAGGLLTSRIRRTSAGGYQ